MTTILGLTVSASYDDATRSGAAVGQAAVSSSVEVDSVTSSEPHPIQVRCPSARIGLRWYRMRHGYWVTKRGTTRPVTRKGGAPRNCADARYLADVWRDRSFAQRQSYERWWERVNTDPDAAIDYVFGPTYAWQAKRVAGCESGDTDGDLSPHVVRATNGQYLGMFQMGSFARSTYGHSSAVLGQVRAAHRYFVASGRDWSPWSCTP